MPDSTSTPPLFRVARRSLARSPHLTWAPPGDLAHGLLEAMSAAPVNLSSCWAWLQAFDLCDAVIFAQGQARTVSGTADITCERVRLTSHSGDQVFICHAPNATLSTRDLAGLGAVVMLASGGMGQSKAELEALYTEGLEEHTARKTSLERALGGECTKALWWLTDALTACVAPPNAPLSLHPLRRDEPSDLVLGDCTLRVYDGQSHKLVRFLLTLAQSLRAGAQGRP